MTTTFLIADDTAFKIAMMKQMVHKALPDATILTCGTTEAAKEMITAHPEINAAFIDFYMPSENGPAVIRALKEANPKALIALASSSEKQSNQDAAMAAGASAFVSFAYPEDVIKETIERLLEEWKETL